MYGKIFESIYYGSLHGDWQTMVVFQQLIVLADRDGVVDRTPAAISAVTGIPQEIIEAGIQKLEQPDPMSRTPGDNGRRLRLLDSHRTWGWEIVNHAYYRDLSSAEDRRAKDREKKRKQRENARSQQSVPMLSPPCPHLSPMSPHTEEDADAHTEAKADADFNKKDSASAESLITGKPVSEGVGVQDFFDRWNRFADKTPKLTVCRKLTDKRRSKIRSRLNETGWFEDFKEAVCALPLGGDGWQPGLDWLIRNEHNIYLIMEGAFDFRNRDDPAAQKLAAQRRKAAFNQREAEEKCRTEQMKQELDGRQKAIANISPAPNGNAEEIAAVSLLFGTDEDSFASGVEN